jgi:hypothetical protein
MCSVDCKMSYTYEHGPFSFQKKMYTSKVSFYLFKDFKEKVQSTF